jgi:hypothetical protein
MRDGQLLFVTLTATPEQFEAVGSAAFEKACILVLALTSPGRGLSVAAPDVCRC